MKVVGVALGAVALAALFGGLAALLAGIWTGDPRWGDTGATLSATAVLVGFLSAVTVTLSSVK